MSGFVTGIAISPQSPYDLYVRTDVGGLYRFNRQGKNWRYLFNKFPTSARAEGVESLAVDPTDPNTVYAAFWRNVTNPNDENIFAYPGEVWKSTDKGETWGATGLSSYNIAMEPNGEFRAEAGERLAVDPNRPDHVWFGSRNDGVWVKRGNANWQQVSGLPAPSTLFWANENRTDRPGFTWILFDKASGTTGNETPVMYVGAYGSGVWRRSAINGAWTKITSATPGDIQEKPLRAAIAPNGDLFCMFSTQNMFGSGGKIHRYRNGVWTDLTPSDAGAMCGIAVHPDGQQILISGNTDVWKSNNGGTSWQRCDPDLRYPQSISAPEYMRTSLANNLVVSIAFDPANTNEAWFTNGFGVGRSFNANASVPTWAWEMLGLEEFVGVMTCPTPATPFYVYTAVMDKAGFKTSNLDLPAKKSIQAANVPVPADTPTWIVPSGTQFFPVPLESTLGCSSIDVAWGNPQQAAYVGYHQVVDWIPFYGKTNDHGETWQAFGSIPTRTSNGYLELGAAGQIAVDRRGTDRMCWVPSGFKPHFTTDGGQTWNVSKFAGTNNDVFSSWGNNINARVRSGVLVADKRINGRMYYVESTWDSTIMVSQDAGATFSITAKNVLPTYRLKITIAPNPFLDNDVWISTGRNTEEVDAKSSKLVRSTNGGQTWSIVGSVDSCEFVAIGIGEGSIPYYVFIFGRVAGATQDTLYRSGDGGITWTRLSDPAKTQFNGIVHLAADPRVPNLLYISASGRGHMYLMPPGLNAPT